MTTPHGTADDKPDMPDTTLAFDASPTREPGGERHDDAAGYYVDGDPVVDTKSPGGPLEERWGTRKFEARIANPANRRRLSIIVVGTGLPALPRRPRSARPATS
jgi:succinate dehydrogenase / fumarate reductase flavoprotein subunit